MCIHALKICIVIRFIGNMCGINFLVPMVFGIIFVLFFMYRFFKDDLKCTLIIYYSIYQILRLFSRYIIPGYIKQYEKNESWESAISSNIFFQILFIPIIHFLNCIYL